MRFQIDYIPKENERRFCCRVVFEKQILRRFLPINFSFFGRVNLRESTPSSKKKIFIGQIENRANRDWKRPDRNDLSLFLFIEPFLPTSAQIS
jgi:hypothetical protein